MVRAQQRDDATTLLRDGRRTGGRIWGRIGSTVRREVSHCRNSGMRKAQPGSFCCAGEETSVCAALLQSLSTAFI